MDPTDPTNQNSPQGEQNNQQSTNPLGSSTYESGNINPTPEQPSMDNSVDSPLNPPTDPPSDTIPNTNVNQQPTTLTNPTGPMANQSAEAPADPPKTEMNTDLTPETTYAGPSPTSNPVTKDPTSTTPINDADPSNTPGATMAAAVQPPPAGQTPDAPVGNQDENLGPAWLRTDPSSQTQDQTSGAPDLSVASPTPPLSEVPPPWQTPAEAEEIPATPSEVQTEEKQGGFPVIIFIVLIVGIIIAILAFLFTQGALPFIS